MVKEKGGGGRKRYQGLRLAVCVITEKIIFLPLFLVINYFLSKPKLLMSISLIYIFWRGERPQGFFGFFSGIYFQS